MSIESATFISQLEVLNPQGLADPVSQGDDHLRLIKGVLKNTFVNASGAINPTPAEFNTLVGVTSALQVQINEKSPLVDTRKNNLIWNGSMECWQDGTSRTGVTSTSHTGVPDGFRFSLASHGTWTIGQSSTVPTTVEAGRHLNSSFRAIVTTTDVSVAVGSFAALSFFVSGYEWQDLYQQPLHISFWVRSTTIGTYCVALRNSALDRSYVITYTVNAPNVWELKQISVTAVPSGGVWDFQGGVGVELAFVLTAGATFQTSAGVWQTGNFLATSAQTNLGATVNNDFSITDIRMHGGTVRSSVVLRSFPEILREAQQRFFKTFDYDVKPAVNAGTNGALTYHASVSGTAGSGGTYLRYPVVLRSLPAFVFYNTSTSGVLWRNLSLDSNSGSPATQNSGDSGVMVTNPQVTADSTPNRIAVHLTADARF